MIYFPHYRQVDSKDCGPTCLKIIAKYYKVQFDINLLRTLCETSREGSNLHGLSRAAESIGFKTLGAQISLKQLETAPLPCILFWDKYHYVVLYKIKKKKFYISDPALGLLSYDRQTFMNLWIGAGATEESRDGIVLLLEPSATFIKQDNNNFSQQKLGSNLIFKYLYKYKSYILQLVLGLIASSILQVLFPFLTQSIVDVGIKNRNLNFINLILLAQLMLFIGRVLLEFIRNWTLLHLSSRINISMLSDFFIKLMNLPISYFDNRLTGDIMQRIHDHDRIEKLLTSSSLTVVFSLLNIILMGIVLIIYSIKIFAIFFIGSFLYFFWTIIFLKQRKIIDYKRFSEVSQEQSKVIELISGMQEIKLHNAERQKRWNWEHVQARLFEVSISGLKLEQIQNIGASFINELKNIIIVYFSAKLVIDGEITLGIMLAITSIVGNLNGPVASLVNFTREYQDAKIAFERLREVHEAEDESSFDDKHTFSCKNADIEINDISFRYPGAANDALKNINLKIPANKITAIVGASGSGKTTLMKILLKFYEPQKGNIVINKDGKTDYLHNISQRNWRSCLGTVMQDGYIFNDTIAHNIAVGVDLVDKHALKDAATIANVDKFIDSMPMGYNSHIGMEGSGISGGQKQRILIARAVYKNPEILFFDEATSALDANNESEIMQKLTLFFKNKTVMVIAHRLSTVKNADQIIVLDKGEVVETGTHDQLISLKGNYYNLIKNQLELGS